MPKTIGTPHPVPNDPDAVTHSHGHTPGGIVSTLADWSRLSLAELSRNDDALDSLLRRIVPEAPEQWVPVAAFNSSI